MPCKSFVSDFFAVEKTFAFYETFLFSEEKNFAIFHFTIFEGRKFRENGKKIAKVSAHKVIFTKGGNVQLPDAFLVEIQFFSGSTYLQDLGF